MNSSIPAPVLKALAHVRKTFPRVSLVTFNRDTRWHYMTADFDSPGDFGDSIDTGILEDAQSAVENFPAVFQIEDVDVGDTVLMPDPLDGDSWSHGDFSAVVVEVLDSGLIVVRDAEDDCFTICPSRVSIE